MKKTIILLITLLLITNMTPVTDTYLAAEVTNPVLESISVDKKIVTAGDTVNLSMKLKNSEEINYIIAWYNAPITQNYVYVYLYYNSESRSFEGSFPIQSSSESGVYNLNRLTIYEPENTVDIHQSEIFQSGDFIVSGTNGEGVLESLSLDKKEVTSEDTVIFDMKVSDKEGINYILLWITSPITRTDIYVRLDYSESNSFRGSLPVFPFSESGEYKVSRIVIYGEGNMVSLHQSELFNSGNFMVSGTNGAGVIESLGINMKEVTVGDVVKFNTKVRDKEGINYILLWCTTPITFKTIYVYLYYNSESDSFEGSLPINSSNEIGEYAINRLTIYSSGVTYGFVDTESKLENLRFTVFSEENPPSFSSLSVSKKEVGSGESIKIYVDATDDTNLQSATINYISPGQSIVSIPLQYDGTHFIGDYYISDNTELGNWTVDSVEIKDTNENATLVKASEIDLTAGSFFIKDVTAPGQPTVNAVNDKNTSLTGQAEAGSKVEVKVNGTLIGSATAGTDGKFTVTIPVQKAGTEIVVTATDKAGNVSPAAKVVVKDVTAPGQPTVNAVNDKNTSVTGQAEAGSKVEVKVNGTLIGSATAGTDENFTVTIPVQKAGTEIVITATDKTGNVSLAAKVVVKDVTAPGQPTVNAVNDKNTSVTGQAEAGSKVEVKVNGTLIGSATAGTDGKFTVTIPVQKAGTEIVITATDKAGNVSTVIKVVVKDVTAPGQPTVNAVTDKNTSVTGQAEADSKVEVKVNGAAMGSSTAGTDGKFTVTIPVQKAGTEIVVTATDKAGNVSTAAKVVVKDVTAPGQPTVNEVSDKDASVMGQAEAGSKIEVKVNGALIGSDTTDSNGLFLVAIPVQKSGTKVVFTAADSSGNVSEGLTVTVKDATSPEAPKVVELTDRETKLTGSAEPSSTIIAKVSGVEIGRGAADGNGQFAVTIPKQASGKVVEVSAKDNAGNVSPATKVTVKKKLVSLVGETRYATAVKVAQTGWNTADTVLLVNGFAIVDGLTATPLASAKSAPILLTAADSIPQPTMDEITRLKAKEIILIGGTGVITPKVEKELVAKGFKVTRIGGLNRKDTSLLIAKELDKLVDVSTIYVAYGWGEPDALSIAAQAGLKKQPIILADKTAVPADTFAWLKTEALSDAYFIGGEGVVSPAILSEVDKITSGNVLANRLSGLNRHETNAKVMSKFYPETDLQTILVAKSETPSLVDALAAGPLAAKFGSPVLLVSSYVGLLPEQQKVLAGKNSKYVHQIGGGVNPKALSEVVE
jgi:putative cell wall-binding protein